MPIVSVSRWNIEPERAQQLLREAASLLKQQGASRIALGRIQTGSNAGQTTVAVEYNDWQTFGRAMENQKNDQKYQQLYEQAQNSGRGQQQASGQQSGQQTTGQGGNALQDRTIIAFDDVQ